MATRTQLVRLHTSMLDLFKQLHGHHVTDVHPEFNRSGTIIEVRPDPRSTLDHVALLHSNRDNLTTRVKASLLQHGVVNGVRIEHRSPAGSTISTMTLFDDLGVGIAEIKIVWHASDDFDQAFPFWRRGG